uniref:Uncharacterized protein n=1 Tax=uncultured Verrucomicrobiota bacterium TaxID=156588 RepID=D2DXX1_9BACT|nr:hypothetical protein [uncultured Verrucomicrobiota bacterium]
MQTSKNLVVLAFFALAAMVCAEDAADALKEAHQAYLKNDLQMARLKFARVLELDPGNREATRYLRVVETEITRGQAGKPAASVAEARIKQVTLPKIEFREATLAEAAEFFRQKCNQVLGPDKPVNIVLLLSDEAKGRKITFNLSNIPASEVLRYMAQQGNVEVSYDQFSVVIKDRAAAPPADPKPGA